MDEYNGDHSLDEIRGELEAWEAHIERCGLGRRQRFIDWLAESLCARELALAIDSELERSELRKTYFRESYGPLA